MKGCEESDESARNCAGDALRRKVSDESPDESLFQHSERDRECHLIVAHGALWERDYGEEDRSWAKHAHASHARLPFCRSVTDLVPLYSWLRTEVVRR